MSTELDVIRRAEQEDKVISMYARAYTPSQISKSTGLTIKEINQVLASFKQYAMQDKVLREMSRETVLKTRQHYDDLIGQMYEAIGLAESEGDYNAVMKGVKAVADIEKQRVDFMQKAGMLADNEIGDQLIESERKQKIIIDIIRELSKKYPKIGLEFQERLKEVTGVVEGVPSERLDR